MSKEPRPGVVKFVSEIFVHTITLDVRLSLQMLERHHDELSGTEIVFLLGPFGTRIKAAFMRHCIEFGETWERGMSSSMLPHLTEGRPPPKKGWVKKPAGASPVPAMTQLDPALDDFLYGRWAAACKGTLADQWQAIEAAELCDDLTIHFVGCSLIGIAPKVARTLLREAAAHGNWYSAGAYEVLEM